MWAVGAFIAALLLAACEEGVRLPSPTPQGEVLCADGFERSGSETLGVADTGQSWETDENSTWGVEALEAKAFQAEGFGTAFLQCGAVGDIVVEADITLSEEPNRANAGLVFRYAGQLKYLWIKLELTERDPGLLAIGEVRAGRSTSLEEQEVELRSGALYHVRVEIEGATVTATIQGPDAGTAEISYELSSDEQEAFAGAGAAGLRIVVGPDKDDKGSLWDNFVVSALPA